VSFSVQRHGERLEGLATGIDRKHLDRLKAGRVEVEYDIDLHGLGERDARYAVRHALEECFEAGGRCLLVVHGRGKGSELGPVLKESLVEWLTAPPAGRRVMAFSSARPEDGGAGATYVLLRRRRGVDPERR
jgi:DNA-nicking Smr family endonuclease